MSSANNLSSNGAKRRKTDVISQQNSYGGSQQILLSTPSTLSADSQYESQRPSDGTPLQTLSSNVAQEVPPMTQFLTQEKRFENICVECDEPVMALNDNQCIECSDCRLYYHLRCVQLNQRIYDLIQKTHSIKWICYDCRDLKKERPLFTVV